MFGNLEIGHNFGFVEDIVDGIVAVVETVVVVVMGKDFVADKGCKNYFDVVVVVD